MAAKANRQRPPQGERDALRDLQLQVDAALAPLDLPGVTTEIREGHVRITGYVPGGRQRDLVEQAIEPLDAHDLVAVELVDEYEGDGTTFGPDPEASLATDFETIQAETWEPGGLDPAFTYRDVGSDDAMEAISEAEPYFPPTDPVTRPSARTPEGVEIVGGFAASALDQPTEVEDHPLAVKPGDDEIAEEITHALRLESATADLPIAVRVRRGVVHLSGQVASLTDIDLAEEVAYRVRGVVDVHDDLEVEGMQ